MKRCIKTGGNHCNHCNDGNCQIDDDGADGDIDDGDDDIDGNNSNCQIDGNGGYSDIDGDDGLTSTGERRSEFTTIFLNTLSPILIRDCHFEHFQCRGFQFWPSLEFWPGFAFWPGFELWQVLTSVWVLTSFNQRLSFDKFWPRLECPASALSVAAAIKPWIPITSFSVCSNWNKNSFTSPHQGVDNF